MTDKLCQIFDIAGRTVVLTGAAGFFGRHMATTLLEVGANVVLMSRSDKLDAQAKGYCDRFGAERAVAKQVDFYDRDALSGALEEIVASHQVDVLINNACDMSPRTGFNVPQGCLADAPYEQWLASMESGLYWAAAATRIIGEQLCDRGEGSIINVSSMYGLVAPNPTLYEGTDFLNPPFYSVAKAGLIGLTRYTASFWGPKGVRCNALVPGPFPNVEHESDNSVKPDDNAFLKRLVERTALRRVGKADELGGALIFLASGASSYVTGQTIVVDGGWTIT